MASIPPGSSAEQQSASPDKQLAILIEQQIVIPDTNQSVQEKNDSQSSQQQVQQKDYTNNLTQLHFSFRKMETFSSQFRSKQDQLNNITLLIPNKSKETNCEKEQVDKAYSDFKKSVSDIVCAYSQLQDLYYQFRSCFNQVKMQLATIYQSIFMKIKQNQVLQQKFLDAQKTKLDDSQTQINKLLQIQDDFKIQLKKKGFIKKTTELLFIINKVEQYTHKKEEVEKSNAELLRRDKQLNEEKANLELAEISMNFSKQQEERLEKDYQATIEQKKQLIEQFKLQQKDLKNIGNDKKKYIAMINNQIEKNQQAKEKMNKAICKDHFNRNQSIERMFDNTLNEINNLQITQSSQGFIVVLDESGSMDGKPFENCIVAIKEQLKCLKSDFPDHEFCMIQFDSKARVIINKSAVQFVKEAAIKNELKKGGTNFHNAFLQVKEVIPLFDSKVINIMFITDGEDSNTSAYLKVLEEIKQEYPNNKFQLFGLAFGSSVNPDNIKDCLKVVNGNPIMITANGKKIQSYFEVNVAEDLIKAFKKMFEAQSESIEEFKEKDKKRRELIAQQQEDSKIMRDTLLKQFDDEYEKLVKEFEKATEDNNISQTDGYNFFLGILNQKTEELDKKLEKYEKEIESLKKNKKKNYLEKINQIKNVIKDLEMQRENFLINEGSLMIKDQIQQDVKEYEEEISKLGFSSKNHYDKLKGQLTNADLIEKTITNFLNEMAESMQYLNQIRQQVSEGVDIMREPIETNQENLQFLLFDLVQIEMNRMGYNLNLNALSNVDKMKFLIQVTSKDEYARILEEKELDYPFNNLYSALELSDLFKLQKVKQKSGKDEQGNPIQSVDQYVEKVFKEITHFQNKPVEIPGMVKIQEKLDKLENQIEEEEQKDEPSSSKLEKFEKQKEKLKEQLEEFSEKIEKKNEDMYQQFIADHKRQYDFTRNVIRNIRQAIQLIEYKSKQTSIF